jgi:hypothetical protein
MFDAIRRQAQEKSAINSSAYTYSMAVVLLPPSGRELGTFGDIRF